MSTDPAVTAAAEAIHVTAFQALGDAAEAVVAAVRPIIEAEVIERMRHAPGGWYPFGWHTNGGLDGIRTVFSDEVDDTGLPMYERLVADEAEVRERIAADIGAMTLKQIGMGVSLFDAARDQAARIARGQA